MTQLHLYEFCIRLAAGLACMMVSSSARDTSLQFFRTLMLVVLGLSVLGLLTGTEAGRTITVLTAAVCLLAFAGFVVWRLGRETAGRWVTIALFVATTVCLLVPTQLSVTRDHPDYMILSDRITSALILGSVVAAMLLGHSYLIAPAMSIAPLKRLVLWLAAAVLARALVAGAMAFQAWSETGMEITVSDSRPITIGPAFLISARWLIGFLGPAMIVAMVWHTARIRATQAATGILYAGVIMVFLGELLDVLIYW